MGTTALTLLQRVATSDGNMKLFVVLSTVSLAACIPAAHLLHPGLVAVVPVGTHQWPGITTAGGDKTCFGCRPAVVAAIHGRKRRDVEPVAAAEPHGLLPGFFGHPYLPLHATAVVGSSSYQTVDNNGAKYTTGVSALHPVFIHGRRKRGAEAEAEPEAVAEAEAEPEAAAAIPLPAAPLYALNGYAHSLPGNSYASISTPNLYHALPHHLPLYPLFG